MVSAITERPYIRFICVAGTLPGRKPLIRTWPFSSSSRASTLVASSAIGTTTLNSRLRPSLLFLLLASPISSSLVAVLRGMSKGLVRAEGLEPPRLSPLEPKSSASTNSATPARKALRGTAFGRAARLISWHLRDALTKIGSFGDRSTCLPPALSVPVTRRLLLSRSGPQRGHAGPSPAVEWRQTAAPDGFQVIRAGAPGPTLRLKRGRRAASPPRKRHRRNRRRSTGMACGSPAAWTGCPV